MVTPPLLVFDLDGTLAETVGDLVATLNVILSREGLEPVDAGEARSMVGMGARKLIERGFKADGRTLSPDRLEQLFADYVAYYEAHLAVHTHFFDGALRALDRFAAAGWNFAICTNKATHASVKLIEALGATRRFTAICGQDMFAWCKPDGRALLMTIERAGGDPRRSVMVGDSRPDVDAARNAKVPVIGVDFGYTDTPIAALGPDRVISHFDELWDAVRSLDLDVRPA